MTPRERLIVALDVPVSRDDDRFTEEERIVANRALRRRKWRRKMAERGPFDLVVYMAAVIADKAGQGGVRR